MRSSKQSSNRTFSLIHDILNDIDLRYPESISDFQASDIPVIDQVIGKMAADSRFFRLLAFLFQFAAKPKPLSIALAEVSFEL